MEDLSTSLQIHHYFSSLYIQQGNGQVKGTYETLLKILKRVVNDFVHDQHMQINPTLWAYITSFHTSIGINSYSITYSSKVVMPIDVEFPSLCISLQGVISDEDYRVARLTQLDLLDERRKQACNYLAFYQNKLKHNFNKNVHP